MNFNSSNSFNTLKNTTNDRYIFFKDQKAVTNVLDIEICLRSCQNIKCLLVIEQSNPISILKTKIPETLEKFQKLSGVSYPKVTNLSIRRDKEISLNIDSDKLIEEVIRPGDILLFDMNFKEIWIDVSLVNTCSKKKITFDFELKINLDKSLFNLVINILKLGIKSFHLNKQQYPSKDDALLLSSFQMQVHKTDSNITKVETVVDLQSKISGLASNFYSGNLIEPIPNIPTKAIKKSIITSSLNLEQSQDEGQVRQSVFNNSFNNTIINNSSSSQEPQAPQSPQDKDLKKKEKRDILKEMGKKKLRDLLFLDCKIECELNYSNINIYLYDLLRKKMYFSKRLATSNVEGIMKNVRKIYSIFIH